MKNRLLSSAFIALFALALTGCPERRRIGDITGDPGRFNNKEVTVVGRVTRSYGVAGVGVFEIDDGTGKLWVLSEKYGVPSKDAYVGVSGKIIPGLTYGGRNYGTGMQETKRRTSENR